MMKFKIATCLTVLSFGALGYHIGSKEHDTGGSKTEPSSQGTKKISRKSNVNSASNTRLLIQNITSTDRQSTLRNVAAILQLDADEVLALLEKPELKDTDIQYNEALFEACFTLSLIHI